LPVLLAERNYPPIATPAGGDEGGGGDGSGDGGGEADARVALYLALKARETDKCSRAERKRKKA
jgi:hypothetical protein